jgi:hypothetical protein
MNMMMLSCMKASELIEKKQGPGISTADQVMLHFHQSMCNACRIYERQSKLIEKGLEKRINHTQQETSTPENFKSNILNSIINNP